MATPDEQLLGVAGVLALLIGTMLVNHQLAARHARAASSPGGAAAIPGFVGKYAHHAGAVVGRIVAREGDLLVVEQAGMRRTVPVAAAREEGGEVVLSQEPA
jgi:hypothetical protein